MKNTKVKGIIKMFIVLAIIITTSCNTGSGKKSNSPIVVFCASSLHDVLLEITNEYSKTNKVEFKINSASSGTLARQIEFGAKADLFISADIKWIEYIISKNLALNKSKIKIAGNSLVFIVPIMSKIDSLSFMEELNLPDIFKGRLSIGDPEYVPAGTYAKQALESLGYMEILKSRILPAKDATSALKVVELGETELGIVFLTDALKSNKVKSVGIIPENYHQPIEYWAVQLSDSENITASSFQEFLCSEKAKEIWAKFGFTY